ncbi:MAG: isoprenyl transferase [Bacteroidia bacterium]
MQRPDLDWEKPLPRHVAIIMDGNGRWAKKRHLRRIEGHKYALEAIRQVVEGCIEVGIPFLTLYAFSTENWGRPQTEVNWLMQLLSSTLKQELDRLIEKEVRLCTIGELMRLPSSIVQELEAAKEKTQYFRRLTLTLALSYGGRQDILQAAAALMRKAQKGELAPEDLTAEVFARHLSTHFLPEPELLIRTSGELRISNFLLWECAYAEFYFTPIYWPDFRKTHLWEALRAFQQRERRFGKVSEACSEA